MHRLATIAEAIASTTKKTEKVRLLADYVRSRTVDEAAVSAVFLSGRVFPAWEEVTLQVGGALLVRVILEVSGEAEPALENAYRRTGDLGAAAYQLLLESRRGNANPTVNVVQVAREFREIAAAHGPAAKAARLRHLLERATPLEAKYLIKIVTGELRIGLKESLVEEAIASAYGVPVKEVQRADMLLGDIGDTLRLAAAHELSGARMRLFHPLGFMLASPVASAEEAFEFFQHAQVEDKYDGIRAQAHCGHEDVRLFSRTLDEVSESFPELLDPLSAFDCVILDGEIVAWDFAQWRALPFSELQKRLGRKKVTPSMMRAVPVTYVVFDVLYANGELVIDRPLTERDAILERLFADTAGRGDPGKGAPGSRPRFSGANLGSRYPTTRRASLRTQDLQGKLAFEPAIVEDETEEPHAVLRAPVLRADSAQHLEELFALAQARGNEGLMIKDVQSVYTPGRRGRSWVKLKRELATLDVVVTSVEWGHGKRIGVLSDYTFAVRDGARLVNVGKAYSGLTDREIAQMTEWFLAHTTADHGFWREVEPKIVIEVAFNAVMRSDRHNSGYALRFPRILRLRPDKPPDEIDTLERVREIHERQQLALSRKTA
jgi:DNA ligase-1